MLIATATGAFVALGSVAFCGGVGLGVGWCRSEPKLEPRIRESAAGLVAGVMAGLVIGVIGRFAFG